MACSSLCKQACMQEHMKTLTQTLTVTKAAFPPQELLPGTRDHTFSYVWGNYLTPHQKGPCFGWFWSAEHFWLEYPSLPPTPGCKSSRLFLLCQRIFFPIFFLLLNFHGPFKHFLFPWKQISVTTTSGYFWVDTRLKRYTADWFTNKDCSLQLSGLEFGNVLQV